VVRTARPQRGWVIGRPGGRRGSSHPRRLAQARHQGECVSTPPVVGRRPQGTSRSSSGGTGCWPAREGSWPSSARSRRHRADVEPIPNTAAATCGRSSRRTPPRPRRAAMSVDPGHRYPVVDHIGHGNPCPRDTGVPQAIDSTITRAETVRYSRSGRAAAGRSGQVLLVRIGTSPRTANCTALAGDLCGSTASLK